MVGTVIDLKERLQPDGLACSIVERFSDWRDNREGWEQETLELRNYVFATDTTTTTNNKSGQTQGDDDSGARLEWSNKTHVPKITQIYDNLKANYMSALFPNDDWLMWEAGTTDAANVDTARTVKGYMQNKLREDNFYTTVSRLIDDYVLYGNAFADAIFVKESKVDPVTGETIPGYVGPRAVRYSPYDVVFNPLSTKFTDTPKITRTLWNIGEFYRYVKEYPDQSVWIKEALADIQELRSRAYGQRDEDYKKATAIEVDGFTSYDSYLRSGVVEILELQGDYYDSESNTFYKDMVITIADRRKVLRKETNPSWFSGPTMSHVSWRERPDNLWGMSPLANIVGMQYRINHLENSKADAIDLNVFPPIKVVGEVDDYTWAPGAEIIVDTGGDVQLLSPDLTALAVDQEIQFLMDQMELFTGAPRETMGIRSPGEKTAFEVDTLVTAASRIFQEKIRNFEINLLEPLLNTMLEVAKRNVDGSDLIRVMDDDLGVAEFINIKKEDITASGKLRPVGARHFARQAQVTQNLLGLANSGVWQVIQQHVSRKQLTRLVEDILGLDRFSLFGENLGLMEDAESAQVGQRAQADLQQGVTTDEQGVVQGIDQGGNPVA